MGFYLHKVAYTMFTIVQCDYMLLFEKLYVGGKIEKNLGLRGKLTDSVCVWLVVHCFICPTPVWVNAVVCLGMTRRKGSAAWEVRCSPSRSVLLWRCTSVFSEDCLPRRARSSVHSVCCVWWVLHTRSFTCLGALRMI